jgi:hypothetical protein
MFEIEDYHVLKVCASNGAFCIFSVISLCIQLLSFAGWTFLQIP